MKKIIKPFTIEEWENGAEVVTRAGRPVRILCTDVKCQNGYPIVAVIEDEEYEHVHVFTEEGHYNDECDDEFDLVIVEEVEEPEEHGQYNGDVCGDNRFEIIDAAKKHLLDATNINTSPKEMEVLDTFLFRCWQMGWLKDFDANRIEDIQSTEVEEPERWADDKDATGEGWYIDSVGDIHKGEKKFLNDFSGRRYFATKKQAKSALAMARISQLMANDERYGGVVTDEEWKDRGMGKSIIHRDGGKIGCFVSSSSYYFLAFHTDEQRELFLRENEQLVKDYLMID